MYRSSFNVVAQLRVACGLHCPALVLARWLVGLVLAFPIVARADCPTTIQELPPIGVPVELATPDTLSIIDTTPAVEVRASAASTLRMEAGDASTGTGSFGGEVRGRQGRSRGCVSADVLDARAGAAHATAGAQMALVGSPLQIGVVIDRFVDLPLSARPEYQRTPLTRFLGRLGIAAYDFMIDDDGDPLRVSAVPLMFEEGFVSQNADGEARGRITTHLGGALVDFHEASEAGTTVVRVFGIDMSWSEPTTPPPLTDVGFVRVSFLSYARDAAWGIELDGGVLQNLGAADCETQRCERGFYVAGMRRRWNAATVGVRAARDGFVTADNLPAFEDRVTLSAERRSSSLVATSSAFVARTQAWDGPDAARRAGARVTLARDLRHGFTALVDGELAASLRHGDDTSAMLDEPGARLLVSLGWRAHYVH